ncbi:MAG: HEPN domain-containing protein [Capsulimonadaceae bacterium]|nr:HEPN domain-containing protein [Capsulimonadaceae bacterium]
MRSVPGRFCATVRLGSGKIDVVFSMYGSCGRVNRMASTANTYRTAANEHLGRAQEQFDSGGYVLAHYLAGLAIECHLRAYLRRKTSVFDSRHDLQLLAKESGFLEIVATDRIFHFIVTANTRWRSNHRYYSERQLLDYMNELRAEFNNRGDRWKNLSRALLNAAYEIIGQGEAKW